MKTIKPNYKVFSAILIGFLLFGVKEFVEPISHGLQGLFALVGLLLIFVSPFFLNYNRIITLTGHIRLVYSVFLVWILFIILRPWLNGEPYTEDSIHPYRIFGLTTYLLPLIVLLGTRIFYISKIFKINLIFAIIGLAYFVINFKNMQHIYASGILNGMGSGVKGINDLANDYYYWFSISSLSLLCFEFLSKRQRWIAIASNVFMLFLLIYFARRGGIFMYILYFMGAFYLYVFHYRKGMKAVKFIFVFFVIVMTGVTVWMYSDSQFSLLFDRLDQDSRSGVDESIINHFNKNDVWICGDGIEGRYTNPMFDKPRYVHETGYYYLILKGGIVYLGLYCYILLQSAYVGFFKTKNNLTKALSLYVLFHAIFLIPFGVPTFGLEYLFVWVSIAFIQSKKWRSMTNEQINFSLNTNLINLK